MSQNKATLDQQSSRWNPRTTIAHVAYSYIIARPKNFRWIERDVLATSGRPRSPLQINWLTSKQGIHAVLTLTESRLFESGMSLDGIEYQQHVPMVDHGVPTLEDLESTFSFLTSVHMKVPVLIHCLGGMGRTGVVLACFLGRTNDWSAEDAIRNVRSIWPRYIEPGQEQAIRRFLSS